VYWFGARPNVFLGDVNVVRHVLSDRTGLYPKNLMTPHLHRLLGKGLISTEGDDWKRHRKVVHPAFNMDKLKVTRFKRCVFSSLSCIGRSACGVNLFLSVFHCLSIMFDDGR
jgi:PHYB activation tagged suppressor 1